MFQFQQNIPNPVYEKIKEIFINNINQLIANNQITNEIGNQIYNTGEPYFQEIVNTLQMQSSGRNVSLNDITIMTQRLFNNVVDMFSQQTYSPQINIQPFNQSIVQSPQYMNQPQQSFHQSMPMMQDENNNNTEKDIMPTMSKFVNNKYSDDALTLFRTHLSENMFHNKFPSKRFFISTNRNKDFYILNDNVIKVQDTIIASYLESELTRPFFYHTDVLKWIVNIDKSFFQRQKDKSINILSVKSKQYRHFVGNCKDAVRTIRKCKKLFGTEKYNHKFINFVKDNNHRIVKIIELLVTDYINELLEYNLRIKSSPKLRYTISSLDDIEELASLDLDIHNDITTHKSFQISIDSIIRAGLGWLFNSKADIDVALVDATLEKNILQLLNTGLIKMSAEEFTEYDYFDLDEKCKEKYLEMISENLLFKIPHMKIITGYNDETFLSRFVDNDYVIISEFKSPFEILLNHVLNKRRSIISTKIHIKVENGFFSLNAGIGLNNELILKKI